MQHITIVGYKKALGTSITIPMEMLNAADLIMRIAAAGQPRLHMQLVSPEGANIELNAGLELVCRHKLDAIDRTDLIIIPALWGNPLGVCRHSPALLDWLRHHGARDTRICAVGTGSFFLAEAGLLRGKVATTHWYYFDHFANAYPDIMLQRDRFITRAGNLYCCGSVNSVRDVMLHFIEEHWSEDVAGQVSRHFTHEIKRSYTSTFLRNAPHNYHDDETIIEIQDWLHSCYQDDLTLERIAGRFGLSVRTLNRRFRQATGKTPLQYLQQVRLDNARELLRSSNLSIAEIAFHAGYPDASYFSAAFRKAMKMTPTAYRDLVRHKLFQLEK
ncbi:MAG: helix-turn-helix domain-containing protein [Pseudomonadales bacterium]|jgi:transcriptional regulator GlxA family with amidase domain|nr:helix-turn-helix domain-containing protein [Pseudomonadales bacterium]